jgi:hypothetical protein
VPFDWNGSSCAHFAAEAVEAMTGVRPFVPDLASERDAIRFMKELSLAERMDAMAARVPPAMAMRGDIVQAQGALGVVTAQGTALFYMEEGMGTLPRAEWATAWAIGRA